MKNVKLLVGNTYKVMLMDWSLSKTDVAPYPNWLKVKVPITVLEEYPTYYVVMVESHNNPTLDTVAKSNPYRVTIDKFALNSGTFKVF